MEEEQKDGESQADFEGDTITISLEDATKIIMEQQGIEGGVLPPGTYTILTQEGLQIATDGLSVSEGEINESVGITVVPSVSNAITEFEGQVTNILSDGDGEQLVLDTQELQMADEKEAMDSEDNDQVGALQGNLEQGPGDDDNQVQNMQGDDNLLPDGGQSSPSTEVISAKEGTTLIQNQGSDNGENDNAEDNVTKTEASESQGEDEQATNDTSVTKSQTTDTPAIGDVSPVKQLDLSKPIEVTNETEVFINGKKCILRANPQTGQLCAYPVLGKKKRGRPPKRVRAEGEVIESPSPLTGKRKDPVLLEKSVEQTNAAEGLLELSNTGPDGIRRSGRARKKAKKMDDYEILEASSDDEIKKEVEDDEELVLPGLKRKKLDIDQREYLPTNTFSPATPGVKRGRGRPRRYPPAGQSTNPTQIPAVIIPSANGQTLMMAPIQGLSNFQAFQQQIKSLPQIVTKIPVVTNVTFSQASTVTSASSSVTSVVDMNSSDGVSDNGVTTVAVVKNEQDSGIIISGTQSAVSVAEALPSLSVADASSPASIGIDAEDTMADDSQNADDPQQETDVAVLTEAAQNSASDQTVAGTDSSTGDVISASTVSKSLDDSEADSDQQTIIQIPEKLLPMFLPKKDPVKLGLKFSDKELHELKCPKCGYQAFYPQQYQTHIATHTEETQKCKCCNFVSFDKETLLAHFKENHPRCICNVCDFMAEHAYVIKRHMMRHNANGCTCELCGRVYKDQYILKMHVRMVHMPAEVLYECTVCSKKFTRKAHLKRHLRIHEPEKPFKCPHCDYRGCERSDISKHILIHEEPKHVCEVCGKAFRHLKNKELHLKRHNGQKDYKCGVCDVYGYTFTDIRKHIERKHSDIKTLVCDKCGAAFKSENLLREHQKQQCEVYMIEQALAIATSSGGTSHATIQIPSTTLAIEGDQMSLNNSGQVNITVEQISLPEEESITLTEEQLQESLQDGSLTISDAHVIESVSPGHITEEVSHAEIMTPGHVEVISQGQIIQDATDEDITEGVDQDHIIEQTEIDETSIESVEEDKTNMIHVDTDRGGFPGAEEETLAIALTE